MPVPAPATAVEPRPTISSASESDTACCTVRAPSRSPSMLSHDAACSLELEGQANPACPRAALHVPSAWFRLSNPQRYSSLPVFPFYSSKPMNGCARSRKTRPGFYRMTRSSATSGRSRNCKRRRLLFRHVRSILQSHEVTVGKFPPPSVRLAARRDQRHG